MMIINLYEDDQITGSVVILVKQNCKQKLWAFNRFKWKFMKISDDIHGIDHKVETEVGIGLQEGKSFKLFSFSTFKWK